jgi:hypothetical protein
MSRNEDEDDATQHQQQWRELQEESRNRCNVRRPHEEGREAHGRNKLRRKVKAKRTKGGSSSSEEEDSSYEEDVSKKGKKGGNNCDKPSYNSMSFNYDNMPITTAYISIPIGKAPYFDGTYYNQWKHCMKNYLYSISLEVW